MDGVAFPHLSVSAFVFLSVFCRRASPGASCVDGLSVIYGLGP